MSLLTVKNNLNMYNILFFKKTMKLLLFFAANIAFLSISNAQVKKIKLYHLNDAENQKGASLTHQYDIIKNKMYRHLLTFEANDQKLKFGRLERVSMHTTPVPFRYAKASEDNSTLVSNNGDTILIYDTYMDEIVNKIEVNSPSNYLLTSDGSIFFTEVSNDGGKGYAAYDSHTGKLLKTFPENPEEISLSQNNRFLVLSEGEHFTVYDLHKDKSVRVVGNTVEKKKQKTGEYFRGVNVTNDGLVAVSFQVQGYFKKTHKKIQHYAVFDGKNGERLIDVEAEHSDKWYLFSIDPSGKVLYAFDQFYDIKTGKELEVEYLNESKKLSGLDSWKFHPYYFGFYHPYGGDGVIGQYSFE